jgi:3-hydroxy-3-methylglutaryl CoA synthase
LSVSFGVESNNDASKLVSSITKALSEKKFKVSNSNNANHFRVILTSNTVQASSYGFTLARSAIDISIKDANGAVIGSNKLNITGQSTQGYSQAKENVAMKLSEMIKKEGIEKVIGLNM